MSASPVSTHKSKLSLAAALLLFLIPSRAWQQSTQKLPLYIIVLASQAEAQRVLEQLNRGGDFAAIAKASSTDPSAADGGYLGTLEPSSLRSELQQGVSGLSPGQVSQIIKIPSGYAILKVLAPTIAATGRTYTTPTRSQAVSAKGAVRVTYDYAGFAAALQAVNRFAKPDDWNRNLKTACEVRTDSIPWVMGQLVPALKRVDQPPAFFRDVNALVRRSAFLSRRHG